MAHGAGGKATQTLIEGLLVPAFASESLEQLGDAGTFTVDGVGLALHDRQLRRQADPLPRRLDRRAGGQRHRQRPRGRRRAPARDQPLAGARGGAGRGRAAGRGRSHRLGGGGRRRRGGDRRHQGGRARRRRLDVRLHGGDRARRRARQPLDPLAAARRPDPRLGPDRRARHRDHAGPRRVRPRRRHQLRHLLALARRRRADGNGRPRADHSLSGVVLQVMRAKTAFTWGASDRNGAGTLVRILAPAPVTKLQFGVVGPCSRESTPTPEPPPPLPNGGRQPAPSVRAVAPRPASGRPRSSAPTW